MTESPSKNRIFLKIVSFGLLVFVGIAYLFGLHGKILGIWIDSFEKCTQFGFEITSLPTPRCTLPSGDTFVRAPTPFHLVIPAKGSLVTSPFTVLGEHDGLSKKMKYELKGTSGTLLSFGDLKTNEKNARFSGEIVFFASASEISGTLEIFDMTLSGEKLSSLVTPLRFSEEKNEPDEIEVKDFDPLKDIQGESFGTQAILDVPFQTQAPFANWDPPFNEACEEASLLITEAFLQGETLSPEGMESKIRNMVNWETSKGYSLDISVHDVGRIAEEYLGRSSMVYTNSYVNVENIKSLIFHGFPVIIPAAGQMLKNPYFRGEGPPYHMLVITGYDKDGFITNDPGTKRGYRYKYSFETIMNAIHDWNGSVDTIRSGKKAMMVIK